MKTAKTTVKQIRAKAFQSIRGKIDRTCGTARFMEMNDSRSDFVYEKSSEINRLIYVCFEAGALTIKQHDDLKRLNMFVTDSCGIMHSINAKGECSPITFDGYYTTR